MFTITQEKYTNYVLHQFFNDSIFVGQVVVYPYKKRDFVVTHVDLAKKDFEKALLQLSREYRRKGKDLYADKFPWKKK